MDNLELKVGGRYRLLRRLGSGGFGIVYEGVDLETNEKVAIKLEDVRIDPSILAEEVEVYEALSVKPGIPRVHWHGTECDFNAAVFDLLGPNLEDLFNYCSRKFSLKTTLMLADQIILRLQVIHSKKIVHRDVKPENFLLGRGRLGNVVYITDFGIALDRRSRSHTETRSLIGTPRFASVNGHLGAEQSPYDDLTSLGYMLIYFLKGSLPWQGFQAADKAEKEAKILEAKQTVRPADLCKDLQGEFAKYFETIRSPQRPEAPRYKQLRRLFSSVFRAHGFEYDNVFDWTVLKFYSIPR